MHGSDVSVVPQPPTKGFGEIDSIAQLITQIGETIGKSTRPLLNLHVWWLSLAESCTVHTTYCILYSVYFYTVPALLLLTSVGLAQAHSITNQHAQQTVCGGKNLYVIQHICHCKEWSPHLMHM